MKIISPIRTASKVPGIVAVTFWNYAIPSYSFVMAGMYIPRFEFAIPLIFLGLVALFWRLEE